MLRPLPCRWFELITTRDELAPVLETLARAGTVELQTHEQTLERARAPRLIAGAEPLLERFHALDKAYRMHWPAHAAPGGTPSHPHLPVVADTTPMHRMADPLASFESRLAQLEAWREQADPLITAVEHLDGERRNLADLARLLAADADLLPDPGLVSGVGAGVSGLGIEVRLQILPARAALPELPAELLSLVIPAGPGGAGESFVLLVGRREALAASDEGFCARKARRIDWPADLRGDVAQAAREVQERRDTLEQRRAEHERALQDLARQHELAEALADIELIEWLIRHGSVLAASDRLVWVTGWTPAPDEAAFCAPLERQGQRCVVQFPEPPPGAEPPSLLANPPWVRAFEAFARMLGQPGGGEADPSPVVALIAPLLFGFMFGDVGQGAVLCIAGWLLRKRAPMLLMLVPGGVMAMLFGLLFGSVFTREDLIPALWLHPLQEPVVLLASAIALGALILFGGMVLNGLQAVWRSAGRAWWASDAGLVLAYVGLLAALAWPEALWLVPAGALWMALGAAAQAKAGRLGAFGRGLALFVEQALQLAVNTVSFARVGAFALAHAGLSAAVIGVAEAVGAIGYWIVLVLGNVLILLLEGLVVGIQTTRLLLFEFFLRFLKGSGRAFRPLPPPMRPASPRPGSAS